MSDSIVTCIFYLVWLLVCCSLSFLRMDQYFETRTWIVPKFAMVVPIGITPFNSEKTATVNTILAGSGSRKMEEWLAVKNIIKVMLVSKDLLADWICASRFAKSTVTLLWSFPSELTVPFWFGAVVKTPALPERKYDWFLVTAVIQEYNVIQFTDKLYLDPIDGLLIVLALFVQ